MFYRYCLAELENAVYSDSIKYHEKYSNEEVSLADSSPDSVTDPGTDIDIPSTILCSRRGVPDPESSYDSLSVLSRLSLIELELEDIEDGFGYVALHPVIRDWMR